MIWSPEAQTAPKSFASGTPSNLRGPSYHGVEVENEVSPSDSSIARSNCAAPSLLVTLILPVTVRIGLSVGSGNDAPPARFASKSAKAPNNGATRGRTAAIITYLGNTECLLIKFAQMS